MRTASCQANPKQYIAARRRMLVLHQWDFAVKIGGCRAVSEFVPSLKRAHERVSRPPETRPLKSSTDYQCGRLRLQDQGEPYRLGSIVLAGSPGKAGKLIAHET